MNGRGVVVTGAGSGIGAACVARLQAGGFQVFAGVRRDEDARVLRQRAADRIVPLRLDVTDATSIRTALETVAGAVGSRGLWGLVNNAGVAVAGPLELVPLELLRHQLEVNVVGQVAVIQAFMPLLRQARGRIVNMGSISGLVALPFLGPYAASKFALEGLTDSLRVELRPWGIHVAIIEPGAVATPIWRKSLAGFDDMSRGFAQQARADYGPVIAGLRAAALARSDDGLPPDRVGDAVVHALTARRPKTRYLVGRDARLRARLRLIPDAVRDGLIARRLPRYGVPGR